MGKYFGTDGIRGRAGDELSPDFALKAGWAIAQVLNNAYRGEKLPFATKQITVADAPAIILARDTRLSSPMLADAIRSGILSAQVNVIDIGVVPTPLVSLAVNYVNSIGGVMITASHNPIEDNGIKVFRSNGVKTTEKLEREIESLIDEGRFSYSTPYFGKVTSLNSERIYLSHLRKVLKGLRGEGMKVGLDLAYGATTAIAGEAFSEFGFSPVILHGEPEGSKVNVDCGATNIRRLASFMKKEGLSLGFAFDGDGDRVICVDDKHQEVNGDKVLAILSLKHRPYFTAKRVVFTEMTNLGVEQYLKQRGFTCYRTPVGDTYVLAEMLKREAKLGGEQSGHVICWDKHCTGDGVFVSLLMSYVLLRNSYSLSELSSQIPVYAQFLTSVPVRDRVSWMNDRTFLRRLAMLKHSFGKGVRFYIRPSGTENLVRILTEARAERLALDANKSVSQLFKRLV